MSVKAAKKMMKKNKDDYKDVAFGNGFDWTIRTTGLISRAKKDDYLYGVWMWPKGSLITGIGYEAARSYLDNAGTFFEERGYTEVIRNQWWNAPQNFLSGGYKYGLVLASEDNTRVVHIFPAEVPSMDGKTTNETAYIKIFSRGAWDDMMSSDAAKKDKDTKDTDF